MKSTLSLAPVCAKKPTVFPVLARFKSSEKNLTYVALFTAPRRGTTVYTTDNENHPLGERCDSLSFYGDNTNHKGDGNWTILNEGDKVTLSN